VEHSWNVRVQAACVRLHYDGSSTDQFECPQLGIDETNCLSCRAEPDCIYSAKKIYGNTCDVISVGESVSSRITKSDHGRIA